MLKVFRRSRTIQRTDACPLRMEALEEKQMMATGLSVMAEVNPGNGHTYHLIKANDGVSGISWSDAEATAQQLGGHLVTINDAAEQQWLTNTFRDPYLWTGLNDARQEGRFEWSSGQSVSYTNWYPGEPNDFAGGEDYVHIYNFRNGRYQWNDNKDLAAFGNTPVFAIAEVELGTSVRAVTNPQNGHVYHLIKAADGVSGISWSNAEATARDLGGHLVTINTAAEQRWVTQTFRDPYLWIGLNDAQREGRFEWSSGQTVSYTNWYPGEPNDFAGGEDHVHIYNFRSGRYQWNDNKDLGTFGRTPVFAVAEVDPNFPNLGISLTQNGELQISGSAYDDTVFVRERYPGRIDVTLTQRGGAAAGTRMRVFDRVDVQQVTFTGHRGNDFFFNLTGDSARGVPSIMSLALGDQGNDTLIGGTGFDALHGGPGNDTLWGREGIDVLYGWSGNDYLNGVGGNDFLFGMGGNDTIIGGDGNDNVWGGDGQDYLSGQRGNDRLRGESGNDVILAGPGTDQLLGGAGSDFLFGHAGDDNLQGGGGNDYLRGGPGQDVLSGQGGRDWLFGDSGNDRAAGGVGNDVMFGGRGVDVLAGGQGSDRIFGGNGSDLVSGDQGNDVIFGGAGNDFLTGLQGNDVVVGDAGRDVLYGGDGNDLLRGGDDGDFLMGENGSDWLFAERGNDYLDGGRDLARDQLFGGLGGDLFRLRFYDWYRDFRPSQGDRIV